MCNNNNNNRDDIYGAVMCVHITGNIVGDSVMLFFFSEILMSIDDTIFTITSFTCSERIRLIYLMHFLFLNALYLMSLTSPHDIGLVLIKNLVLCLP